MTDDGALAGASSSTDPSPSPSPAAPGGSWRAVRIGSAAIPDDIEVTAAFEDGRISGNGGCNRFNASFRSTDSTIAFGPIMSTRMACAGEGGLMEDRYFAALAAITAWSVDDSTLTLSGLAESASVVYVRA